MELHFLLSALKATNPTRSLYMLIKDAVRFHAPGLSLGMNQEDLWTDSFLTECLFAYLQARSGQV